MDTLDTESTKVDRGIAVYLKNELARTRDLAEVLSGVYLGRKRWKMQRIRQRPRGGRDARLGLGAAMVGL